MDELFEDLILQSIDEEEELEEFWDEEDEEGSNGDEDGTGIAPHLK